MLVSALMGLDVMNAAYVHPIEHGYRFYSYGDARCCYRVEANVCVRTISGESPTSCKQPSP